LLVQLSFEIARPYDDLFPQPSLVGFWWSVATNVAFTFVGWTPMTYKKRHF
jgi:hypothetical protein